MRHAVLSGFLWCMAAAGLWAAAPAAYQEAVVQLKKKADGAVLRQQKLRLRLASSLHAIRMGGDVDAVDQQGHTALMLAAQAGEAEVFDLLLKDGADAGKRAPGDVCMLMLAAQGGEYDIFAKVYKLAPISAVAADANGTTLFQYACMGGNRRVCRELLYAGANPTTRDRRGRSCLHYAAMGGNTIVFYDLISKGVCPTLKTHDGYDLLMAAARGGSPELVRSALDMGFVPTSRDRTGNTALMEAARFAPAEVVNLLLQHGASPCERDTAGANAPMYAAAVGNAVAYNIMAGNPNDAPDAKGRTPLVYAACGGSLPLVRQMLNAGADPTVLKRLPLRMAVACGHPKVALEIAARLPQVGADEMRSIPLVSLDDATYFASFLAAHCTQPGDRAAAVSLQRQLHAAQQDAAAYSRPDTQFPGNTPLQNAIVANFRGMMAFLLESGANVDTANRYGRTALMTAVECGNLLALRMLLRAKANPNLVDERGMTALKLAAASAWVEAFDLLLQAGADPAVTRPGSPSTLACAQSAGAEAALIVDKLAATAPMPTDQDAAYLAMCQAMDLGNTALLERILSVWPNANAADEHGRSLLMYAAGASCPDEMLSVLIRHGADVNAVDHSHRMPLHYVKSPTKRQLLIDAGAIP